MADPWPKIRPIMSIDPYSVVGHPIGHSKSPQIHRRFAQAAGHAIEYTAIESPLDGFARTVLAFRDAGGLGMNVTVPFKLEAFALSTVRTPRAVRAGAANVLKFEPNGDIIGENFDGLGLVRDIQNNLGITITGARVLLLGAGGAARGVLSPLLAAQPGEAMIVNRSADKAVALAAEFSNEGQLHGCGFDELPRKPFDILINATSSSLGGSALPIPDSIFDNAALAYDMVYGKGLTPFLTQARRAGARRVEDGLGMLVEQAADAFEWWRGVRPETQTVIRALSVPLV
jgi:shikimate dehydrogenase